MADTLTTKIFLYFTPLLFGGGGAWIIAKFGYKLKILDQANERSSHTGSVPKGGGVGVLLTFVMISISLNLPIFFWLPGLVISLLSFIGDRNELSVKFRLLVQIICSIVVVMGFIQTKDYTFYLLFPLMVLFIAGTANMYNFMDGIDGIAGITSVVAFGFIAYYANLIGASNNYIALSTAMALSSFAFLFFNMPDAKVFMGDVGSVLIGFVFSIMILFVAKTLMDFICMAGFLLPFYMDEITTMAVRLSKKENLTKPHRRHIYQILVNELKIPHWKISLAYGVVQIMVCLTLIMAKSNSSMFVFLAYMGFGLIFVGISTKVRKKAEG